MTVWLMSHRREGSQDRRELPKSSKRCAGREWASIPVEGTRKGGSLCGGVLSTGHSIGLLRFLGSLRFLDMPSHESGVVAAGEW